MTLVEVLRCKQAVFVIILTFALSACATSGFKAEVSRFHALPPAENQTFQVIPGANVEDGIEFKSYLGYLVDHLSAAGYRPAFNEAPQYQVFLDYGSRPDPGYRPSSGPIIGIGIGGFGSHVGGGVSTAIDAGDSSDVYYLHAVNIVINDAITGQRLYEGTASGYGRGAAIQNVMPYLFDALFQDFPGTSGTTDIVKLDTQ